MLSSEALPEIALRATAAARRFRIFLVVGAIGLTVNQAVLYFLVAETGVRVAAASPFAIAGSMIVTFLLNEHWTWRDRGSGAIWRRASMYGVINSGGLIINWLVLVTLTHFGLNYLLANVIGAGVAAIWNFGLNHALTWRR